MRVTLSRPPESPPESLSSRGFLDHQSLPAEEAVTLVLLELWLSSDTLKCKFMTGLFGQVF